MKRIMLIDDEILVRESIRECIDWEREGYIYCGDASDGEVALPIIEREVPDILITDIKMPFMNGLELSTIVRQKYPQIKIIIMSGHDEFEYARSALRIGVEEYCLKPVSSVDILNLLQSVGDKIDKESEEREKLEKFKLRENVQASQTKEKLLNDLCSGFISTADAIHAATVLSVPLTASFYCVIITDIRLDSEGVLSASTLAYRLLTQLETSLNMECLTYLRSVTEQVWIVKSNSKDELQDALLHLRQSEEEITVQAASSSFFVGIGGICNRLQGVHASYMEAEEDKYWRKLANQNRCAFHDTSGDLYRTAIFLDRNKFIEFLKIGSLAQTESFVTGFCEGLTTIDWQSSSYGHYILNDLTLEVFHAAKSLYRHIEGVEDSLQQLQSLIGVVRSWKEACDYLLKLCGQFRHWRMGAADKYADMLHTVKQYIHEHYNKEGLSLQDAATYVNISPSHLSKVFSQETGQTFIEYLTLARINKAIEMLLSTNYKSYEIAYKVGYNDAHYFSNLFRRVTGMTTREYRKQAMTTVIASVSEGAPNAL
ncbi:MAG: response regulator [Candidatus Pristimantibacillus sp.]